ncbi:Fe-S cluster assembly protein SufD [Candidatus Cardinium hertigii]|uniref:Fe-S cluster assembly protein SufD n=1 Tax=Candidatus Cardinium hertigii TaxID=247481 RepID=A0A3N2QCP3_9BACT|nr:Fe-S cluster assembly protein SufD [Candidatus Cardinium hertigii]ROT47565.1 Fe-S cluster assembly protein SufD [Candidatus Cardinium hertigii]
MTTFMDWLAKAVETLEPFSDPFYADRLVAFNKLHHTDFIESQKEHYPYISFRETLKQLSSQLYHTKVPSESFLEQQALPLAAVAVGYGHATKAATLTFVNGRWAKAPSRFSYNGTGIQLRRLADLSLMEQQEVCKGYMADLTSSDDIFVTLNILLAQETYLLEIKDHTQLEDIIVIQHIITSSVTHVVPQFILKIGKESQVTIVEEWYAEGYPIQAFVNSLTHITLAESARLTYYTLHTEYAVPFYHVHALYCNQKDHSTFTHYTFSFGSTMLRINLTDQVQGSHATATLYGLYSLSAKEQVDHRIRVIHSCPHSFSKQLYKCILGGQSTGSFHGLIYLTPDAQQTHAYQTNNAIVLSNGAHHYVKPQLEIYADAVKCSHGATAGQLDQAQLFYLQTRGIEEPLAKRLLLEAFGIEIINTVPIKELQDYLLDKLAEKFIKL